MKTCLNGSSKVTENARLSLATIEFLEPRRLLSAASGSGELVPSIIAETLPSSVVAGGKTTATATIELTNDSGSAVSGPAKVALFFSSTPTFSSSATAITSVPKTVKFKPGQSQTIHIKLGTIPNVSGQFFLLVQATDPAGNVSTVSSSATTIIAAPFIALSETFSKLTLPASAAAGSSVKAVATLDITNGGNVAATGPTSIGLFATTGNTVVQSSGHLAHVTEALTIKPGASKDVNIPITSIPQIVNDTYHILAQVTDSKGDVTTAVANQMLTVAAASTSLSLAFAPLPADPLTTGATVILTNTGSSTVALLPLSYDEGYSVDAAGQDSVGSVIGGFFLGIATQLKPGAHLNLRLTPLDKLSVQPGTYYLTFTLVGVGGSTIGLAVSPTQVTIG